MLTRRRFAGFASCALCGIAEFIATDASAQGAPPASSAGFTRKILSQTEGPMPGYVTIIVEAEVPGGAPCADASLAMNSAIPQSAQEAKPANLRRVSMTILP